MVMMQLGSLEDKTFAGINSIRKNSVFSNRYRNTPDLQNQKLDMSAVSSCALSLNHGNIIGGCDRTNLVISMR